MREPSTEQLEQDRSILDKAAEACEWLIDVVEEERLELEISDYFHKAALATLERLSDVFSHREIQICDELETRGNQAFDKFRRRQIR